MKGPQSLLSTSWHQRLSSFGPNLAPFGTLGHSGGLSWHSFWRHLGPFGPLLASPGTLLDLFWNFLEPVGARHGALLEGDRSLTTFLLCLFHFLTPQSDPKIVFFKAIYGFRF